MHNMVSGTSLESRTGTLLGSGLATNLITPTLKGRLDQALSDATDPPYGYNFSHPEPFEDNLFWDNRVSDGTRVGDGTTPAPVQLQGLGLMDGEPDAETWVVDMASATGEQLNPSNSQVSPDAFYVEPNCTEPDPGYLSSFFDSPPFSCDESLTFSGEGSVDSFVAWGQDTIILKVQGVAQTLGGFNTYQSIVDPALLEGGPIGNYTAPSRRRLQSAPQEPHVTQKVIVVVNETDRVVAPRRTSKVLHSAKEGRQMPWSWFAFGAVALAFAAALPQRWRRGAERDEAAKQARPGGDSAKRSRHHAALSLTLVLGLFSGASADGGCTLDCVEEGIPIPDQTKYETDVFVPPIIDLRAKNGACPVNNHITLDVKEGLQDWGIKNETGFSLPATIWGYTCTADSNCTADGQPVAEADYKPSYPGPTILVTKVSFGFISFFVCIFLSGALYATQPCTALYEH